MKNKFEFSSFFPTEGHLNISHGILPTFCDLIPYFVATIVDSLVRQNYHRNILKVALHLIKKFNI